MPSPDALDLIQRIASGQTEQVDDLFRQDFTLALLHQRLDLISIDPQQFEALLQQAWNDPYLQNLFQNEGQYGLTSVSSYIQSALFTPGASSASPDLTVAGLQLAQAQGKNLSNTQVDFLTTSGTGSGNAIVNTIMRVAAAKGSAAGMSAQQITVLQNVALATAYQESGFNPRAVGDGGTSFGLFQLHEGGELGAMSPDQAYDPVTNASTALDQFVALWKADPNVLNDPGAWAAASQRPADQAGYALAVNAWLGEITAGKIPAAKVGPTGLVGNLPPGTVSEYSPIINAYRQLFGKEPSLTELYDILGHGSDLQQWTDYIRAMPSHIPGIAIGPYSDLRATADKAMQKFLGHDATDAMVKELFDGGHTNPLEAEAYIGFYGERALSMMGAQTYQTIRAANQPHLSSIYNESGFHPAVAITQFQQAPHPATNSQSNALLAPHPHPTAGPLGDDGQFDFAAGVPDTPAPESEEPTGANQTVLTQ